MTISNDGKISVIAPLSQPIVDYTTGMPTKAFADFIFNITFSMMMKRLLICGRKKTVRALNKLKNIC